MAITSRSRRNFLTISKRQMKHESQSILFFDGEATWNASHSDINVSSLAQAE